MLLTISTTHEPAADLGYLLHKHPDKLQSFALSFGQAHVFYPEVTAGRCTAALALEVDPIGLARNHQGHPQALLGHYVNDRPYAASSFLSVAIAQVFGTALGGRCKERPELAATALPFEATLAVLPVRGGEETLRRLFEPLGYAVEAQRHPLDAQFPEWGESPYFAVTLRGQVRLADLLSHLYVLIPVFDNAKHYYVDDAELEKLLAKAAGWLPQHPEKETITRRYLRHRASLVREALARLVEEQPEDAAEPAAKDEAEERLEQPLSLNDQRLGAVLAALRSARASSVVDLGCGEGKLLERLLGDSTFRRICGLDVSLRALEIARRRLRLERLPPAQRARIDLVHGSLMYRDRRLEGFDAAAVVEVIEHLDPPRLAAFERTVFEHARPKTVVVTTPNREYNVKWESLPAGQFRHADHRFEWTRTEFQDWAQRVAGERGYLVHFVPVGPVDELVGAPTQMGVFRLG